MIERLKEQSLVSSSMEQQITEMTEKFKDIENEKAKLFMERKNIMGTCDSLVEKMELEQSQKFEIRSIFLFM